MGCDSCSSGSCSTGTCGSEKNGLPPGMLEAYKLSADRSDGYLVWIEIVRGEGGPRISEGTRRVLAKVREINDGSRVWGIVFGHIELKPLYGEIYGLGVETLYEVHHRELIEFHPEAYASCIAAVTVRTEPAQLIFDDSPRGTELAGRLSGLLECGQMHCSDISADGRNLIYHVGGRRFQTLGFPQIAIVNTSSMASPDKVTQEGTVIYWKHDGSGMKGVL